MSTTDTAVQALRTLEPLDLRVLLAIEKGMSRYQYVPEKAIPKLIRDSGREVSYRLSRLNRFGLIRRWTGAYRGYVLNTAGYDCLGINALAKTGGIEAFGKPLGVGKEADVYDALTSEGRRIAVKFHRLGRISFRQIRRLRSYVAERTVSWLYQSRRAAEKEFKALKLVHHYGVSVPEPINQNRHVVVMGMIDGDELYHHVQLSKPKKILEEILFNLRKAYLEAEVIHADLSEFNVILQPDDHILIIDWPQFVKRDHPNADILLRRDLVNITRFFQRKFKVNTELEGAVAYVKGALAHQS